MYLKSKSSSLFSVLAAACLLALAGCQPQLAQSPNIWAAQKSTIRLEELTSLMAPEVDFQGVESLHINKADRLGWNTDYVVRKNRDVVQISYCEYFSPYMENEFGMISVHLGYYTFSLDEVGSEGFQVVENGVRIVCQGNRDCIRKESHTNIRDRENRNIIEKKDKEYASLSDVLLYFIDEEKQGKVQEMFRDLAASE